MNKEIFKSFTLELSNWIPNLTVLIGAMLVLGLSLLIYNLLTTGKKGYGWTTILIVVGILAFGLRIAISVFREMASSASGSHWDS